MANCHSLFQTYNEKISLSSSKRKSLIKSKNALRDKIRTYFKEYHPDYKPQFYIQGSYKCKNALLYQDNTCDLDDGVYFLKKPEVAASTLQKWVYNSVKDHTSGGQQHKKKCIRVIYKNDYNIDIPVLYMTENDAHPFLAVKDGGWVKDDPKEFVDWYLSIKDANGQFKRITKYLKDWCKNKPHKMPNGLCMTILVQSNIIRNERDDMALRDTLKNLLSSLTTPGGWSCIMPTFPKENLFGEYDEVLKRNFLNDLKTFIEDAEYSVKTKSVHEASKKSNRNLGNRFPIAPQTEEEKRIESLTKAGLAINSGGHYTSVDGKINLKKDGVKNSDHRFYGE